MNKVTPSIRSGGSERDIHDVTQHVMQRGNACLLFSIAMRIVKCICFDEICEKTGTKYGEVQNTVTAYLLQQIQLFAPPGRRGLPPWSAAGDRSAKPTFSFGSKSAEKRSVTDDITTFWCHQPIRIFPFLQVRSAA